MAANGIHFTRVGDKEFPVGFHWTRVGDKVLPVGFGFRPTGEELIGYYLQMKLKGTDYVFSDVIPEINNICRHEPWDLPRIYFQNPGLSPIDSSNQEWYFFSTYEKNSKNQIPRTTKEGFWKITGTQKPVKTEDQRTVIGEKRILTFYQGRVHKDPKKTDWVMHEYYIPQTNPNVNQRDLVVCCVKKKSGEKVDAANCHEGESSTNNNASDFGNQQLLAPRMDIEEEHTPQQQRMDIFELTEYSMLVGAHGDHYHEMPSAFGANERDGTIEVPENSIMDWDAVESSFDWDSEPPVDSRHSRGQKDVKLYQIQAASSVNLVPKPQTDRIQVVTDEHSGTHRHQLVNDEHSGTHQRTKSDKEAEVAQGNNAEKGLKQTQNATTTGNWKGCFISWEASPPLTSTASVYLFNMVVGVIMFCTFAWEAVLSGEKVDAANCHEGESSTNNNASDFGNQQLLAPRMDIEEEHTPQQQSMDIFERAKCRMLGNDYHEKETSLQMLSEPPVDSSHPRRQEGVMLYQKRAASPVNVVPNQLVTDELSGTRRQLVNDKHSGTHQRISRLQRESRHSNALNVKNASSVDVDAELPQINRSQLAPEEYHNNERTRRRTYPTSALEALSKQKELKQQQSKVKEAAEPRAAVDFPSKKTSITESNKEAEVAQGNNAKKGMKQTQNATTAGNWKALLKKISQLI